MASPSRTVTLLLLFREKRVASSTEMMKEAEPGYTGIVDTGPIVDAVLQMTASSVARCDLKISGGQKVGGKVVGDEIYSRLQEELSGRFLHNVAGHIRCCRTQRD